MKVRIYNIDWVIEDEDGNAPETPEAYESARLDLGLPTEEEVDFNEEDADVLEELVTDYLSDRWGFLVNGCKYEVVK